MFKKTKLRLVVLNTIVFFLLLNGFGATLYLYTKERLYSQMDVMLQEQAQHFLHEKNGDRRPPGGEREAERRVVYVFWDEQGQMQLQVPEGALFAEDMEKLRPEGKAEQKRTVSIGGNDYRVYDLPVNVAIRGAAKQTRTMSVLASSQPTQEMLHSLFWVILVGGSISSLLALGVGIYLATKALRPIQQAWNKQQEFVADASHELRTPLTVMKTSLERLFRHPDHTVLQEGESISDAIDETNRMSKLVSQLLTLARSDSNEVEILRQPMQLDALVERTAERFRELAMLKEIQIESQVESSLEVNGDQERLQQLLVILLDNALKYTEDGGRVTVSCRRVSHAVQLEVADTGIGIAAEDLPRVFDRFFRGDKMRARTHPGTGLGLSIAQWIVEAHGGKIRVESEGGKGTRVVVRLPSK
ncbi:sensor histidine kinase [Tumebacillus permanentifrigoris]|uniref:histidine kinase n=1 Tax=Tumebacillus permanentifrigoris TaxID=378543 RepID=A0A316DGT3_9BACL|nr:HAMP domain-containing sensor histidine kinase [Tumebacillus permanentifrigoris]PWK16449.1 phospho-acceptor domain-containing protein [Tumebacillus permanentifrigoris]